MGILDDLQMGLGLKERTEDYDARTARNIALTQAYGDDDVAKMRARQNYTTTSNPFGGTTPFNYGDFYRSAYNAPQGNAQSFLRRQGGEGYSPSIMADNRPFFQRALFSQQGTPSPTRYGIGPVKLDGPLRIPGILGMITGGLFGQRNREIPTVSASGGAMRVRPSGYQPQYVTPPYEIGNSGAGMDYVTPDLSPRDTDYMMDTGPQYTGVKDYALGYGIDSPLLDFRPGTADLTESHIPLDSEVETTDLGPGDDNTISFEEYVESVSAVDNMTGMPVDKSPEAMRSSFERFLKRTGMEERVFDADQYNYDRYRKSGGTMTFDEFRARQGN